MHLPMAKTIRMASEVYPGILLSNSILKMSVVKAGDSYYKSDIQYL